MASDTLHDKLRELDLEPINNFGEGWILSDKDIAQIEAAYKEAGYMKVKSLYDQPLMTGQEFYDRFKAELIQEFDGTGQPERTERWYWENSVMEAAKLAAGLTETDHE